MNVLPCVGNLAVKKAWVHLGDVARHDNFMSDCLLHGLK